MGNLNDFLVAINPKGSKVAEVLTREEEIELGTIIQSPNTSTELRNNAIDKLVLRNIYLALKIAHAYKRKEFELEDLVSYGILGLFRAAEKYNPTRKNRFASYARYWIKDAIMKAIREYSGMPKIPVYLVKNLWKVSRIVSQNENIDNETLAHLADISIANAIYFRSLLFKFIQFDSMYMHADPNTPEDTYIEIERIELITKQLQKLLTIEQFKVLVHSCALCEYPKMTFAEIERTFKIRNPQRIKKEAIKILKQDKLLKSLYTEMIS